MNLVGDRNDAGRVVLSVSKVKGYRLKDVVLRLDEKARWFKVTDEKPPEATTCMKEVVSIITRRMRTREIVAALEGRYSKRAVEDALKEALARHLLKPSGHGWYEPQETTCSTDLNSKCGNVETGELALER